MSQEIPENISEWIQIAEKDWARVQVQLDADDPELAGFCLQQSVEKYLKAYLLAQGWKLRKIHNLDALLTDAVAHDASLERFRTPCQKISAFYFAERYPNFPGVGFARQDVLEAREQAAVLIARLRTALEENP